MDLNRYLGDGIKTASIQSMAEFGASYGAISDCRNTAETFDVAMTDFIKKILNNPEVAKALR